MGFSSSNDRGTSFGILIIRLGLAIVLLLYSVPLLLKGVSGWVTAGTPLHFIRLGIPPKIFGLVVLLIESLGGICLITGYLFRVATALLLIIHGLFLFRYFSAGLTPMTLYHIVLFFSFLGLLYSGTGRYAVAVKLDRK
jgi:putative oxidoreductase